MPTLGQLRNSGFSLPTSLGSIVERVTHSFSVILRALSRRRALNKISCLDDRTLKDIGLFRTDVDAAESLPLKSDPIALLASRRSARNNARFPSRYF